MYLINKQSFIFLVRLGLQRKKTKADKSIYRSIISVFLEFISAFLGFEYEWF